MTSLLIALLAGLALFLACGGDDPARPVPPVVPDLTERWHVLNNIELAYNKRRLDRYNELLDENFTFHFATSDVGGGIPDAWGRAVEISAHEHLFSTAPPDPYPLCKDIDMDIQWEESLVWVEITTPGDEKWYSATVFYEFKIEVEPDMTYISNVGAKAVFTVRNAGTDEAPRWSLVEMRDLATSPAASTVAASTEPSTIGLVKAMYR